MWAPQQTIVPSTRKPHEWSEPAVTAAKAPAGASNWPQKSSSPQQTTVPSARKPDECQYPTLTAV